jgi:hypothetical protein
MGRKFNLLKRQGIVSATTMDGSDAIALLVGQMPKTGEESLK